MQINLRLLLFYLTLNAGAVESIWSNPLEISERIILLDAAHTCHTQTHFLSRAHLHATRNGSKEAKGRESVGKSIKIHKETLIYQYQPRLASSCWQAFLEEVWPLQSSRHTRLAECRLPLG